MYNIYMDSGTSNTRAYLIKGFELLDATVINVGTKDSAISGGNEVLLTAMKECYDKLLSKNGLSDSDIEGLWASGMVTNTFGIVEVEHVSVPVDAHKLLKNIYIHHEKKLFKRKMMLIPGAKTVRSGESITIDNISRINNVRGEEIEAVGLMATGILSKQKAGVMISPGSHTHICYISDGAIIDIISNFTGELNYAIKKDTILGKELSDKDVKMDPQ